MVSLWFDSGFTSEMRRRAALSAVDGKTCDYDEFLRIGLALKELDWERS